MAFQAFATVDDLLDGWPNKELNESETAAAGALLLRASAYLATRLRQAHIAIDAEDELQALNLKTVAVNMVRRSMASGDVDGLSSLAQTIGSTTAQVSWSNPSGAFYLSALDKEILGLTGRGGKAGWASLAQPPDDSELP